MLILSDNVFLLLGNQNMHLRKSIHLGTWTFICHCCCSFPWNHNPVFLLSKLSSKGLQVWEEWLQLGLTRKEKLSKRVLLLVYQVTRNLQRKRKENTGREHKVFFRHTCITINNRCQRIRKWVNKLCIAILHDSKPLSQGMRSSSKCCKGHREILISEWKSKLQNSSYKKVRWMNEWLDRLPNWFTQ